MADLAAGKFIDFTGVLWADIVLNVASLVPVPGLTLWIAWGIRERRHGVRGAAEMNRDPKRSIFARRPRTRWRLAWLSVAGALVLVGVAGVLALQDYDGADSALPMGVLYLVAWAVCMPLLRPRHADGPD